MERFDLKKLNDAEVKEQYLFKITNWFVASENWMIMWTLIGLDIN
jgi:hypothetical protein